MFRVPPSTPPSAAPPARVTVDNGAGNFGGGTPGSQQDLLGGHRAFRCRHPHPDRGQFAVGQLRSTTSRLGTTLSTGQFRRLGEDPDRRGQRDLAGSAANLTIAGTSDLTFSGTMSGPGKLTVATGAAFAYAAPAPGPLTVGSWNWHRAAPSAPRWAARSANRRSPAARRRRRPTGTSHGGHLRDFQWHDRHRHPQPDHRHRRPEPGPLYTLGNVYNATNFTVDRRAVWS